MKIITKDLQADYRRSFVALMTGKAILKNHPKNDMNHHNLFIFQKNRESSLDSLSYAHTAEDKRKKLTNPLMISWLYLIRNGLCTDLPHALANTPI